MLGRLLGQEELSDRNEMVDWSFFNYSSFQPFARRSVVKANGKVYDPMSFRGGENDTYAVAIYLSAEVAVSAAQNRSGHLFDVAVVEGNAEYKVLMAQMQEDLKGNRSQHYATILSPYPESQNWPCQAHYASYFRRLSRFLIHGPPHPVNITDPTPIFRTILSEVQLATEAALGAKLNTSRGFWRDDKIYMYVASPFQLNSTYAAYMRSAMKELGMSQHWGYYTLLQRPYSIWYDHANSDNISYAGPEGTKAAMTYARKEVEMGEYEEGYRYGDFVCGTPYVEAAEEEERERRLNGTWVQPPELEEREWECGNWAECWRSYPRGESGTWNPFW